jgi:photosystem II stability/assembly factor-like uncharacterized protein
MEKKMKQLILFFLMIPVLTSAQGNWTQQTSNTIQLLRSVSFVDAQTGWAAGDAGAIRKTTDGGQSWMVISSGISTVLEGIHFIDPNTGWAAGNSGTIIKTTNGGTSWTPQSSGVTNHLRAVFFADELTGWAVGSAETILGTSNGGSTWIMQNSGSVNNLRSVHFVDKEKGWAVGDSGKVFHTSDGGATWAEQPSGTNRILTTIYFVDHETGWITGTSGTILKTTDGGQTWEPQSSGTTAGMYALAFTDKNTGWAAGSDGVIVHTTNGGETWQQQNSGSNMWIWSLSFPDPNTGWAVGWAGTILHYNQQPPLDAPLLSFPENQAGEVPVNTTFAWQQVAGAESYRLQISTTYAFTTKVLDQTGIADTILMVQNLPENSNLYWRVSAANSDGSSQWSEVWSFTTLLVGIDDPKFIFEPLRLINVFPNPLTDYTKFSFEPGQPGRVKLEILNLTGQQIFIVPESLMDGGPHELMWQPENIRPGIYLYRLSISPVNEPEQVNITTGKLLLVR